MLRTILIFLLLLANTAVAQVPVYQSAKLASIGELLPLNYLYAVDSVFVCPQVITEKSLVIKYAENNLISHLGVSLFSKESKKMINEPACNFIERLFLELLLQDKNTDVSRKLKEYKVGLNWNGNDYNTGNFKSVRSLLTGMTLPCSFKLLKTDNQFVAKWEYEIGNTVTMSFPVSRELIFGTDKKESDEIVYLGLRNYLSDDFVFKEEKVPSASVLNATGDPVLFRLPGLSFVINDLRSDTYYEKRNDGFVPVYNPKYPKETMVNILMGKINRVTKLKITHRMYGHFTPRVEIPVNNFINCFSDEYLPYVGIESAGQEKLKATLVLHNHIYNYLHMLIITVPIGDLFNDTALIEADFFSNIPQHNIKTLFGEK